MSALRSNADIPNSRRRAWTAEAEAAFTKVYLGQLGRDIWGGGQLSLTGMVE
jgi:hypothetical protein